MAEYHTVIFSQCRDAWSLGSLGVVVLGVEVVVKTSFLPLLILVFYFYRLCGLVLPDVGCFTGFGELVAIYIYYLFPPSLVLEPVGAKCDKELALMPSRRRRLQCLMPIFPCETR